MKAALKSKTAILYETLTKEVYDSDNSDDSEDQFNCPNCKQTFRNSTLLKLHIQSAHADVEDAIALAELRETGKVSCPQCSRLFKTPHYLSQHIQFKHNAAPKPKHSVEGKRSRQVYLSQSEYNEMLAADGEEKWILCPHCLHVPFRAQQNLNQHLTIIHPDQSLDPRVIMKLKDGTSVRDLLTKTTNELSKRNKKKSIAGVVIEETEEEAQKVEATKYDREARRKSYTNDFKASVLAELENGVSRKSLSLLHDIPMRTLDKWATTERDRILVASRFNNIAGHKRIRSEDLSNLMTSEGGEAHDT